MREPGDNRVVLDQGRLENPFLMAEPASTDHGSDRTSRSTRVLIVEDNQEGLLALTRIFRSQGYQVIGASDGSEGMAVIAAKPMLDAVLIDFMLPDIDGRELCRYVKSKLSPPPVVAILTGWPDFGHEDLGRWGVDLLFHKPLIIEEMLSRLSKALRARTEKGLGDQESRERFL